MLAATLVGGALRFADLAGVPPGLNQDEAVYGYDAYSLLRTGRDHLGHPFPFAATETFGDWSSSLLSFLEVPAVAILGPTVEALRGTTALLGVLTIPLLDRLAVALFGRRAVGVAAAWVFAVWPWAVHQARWAIIPATVPPLLALALLLLVRALRRGSDRGIVVAALAAGLTVAGYHAMELYVPLLGLGALAIYRREVAALRREAVAYGAAVFAALAGPVLLLSTVDPGGRARFDQTSVFRRGEVGPLDLARQYLAYVSPRFLFVTGDGDPMHAPPGAGLVPWAAAPFLVAGLVWLGATAVRREGWERRSAQFLLVALALAPVPGALTVPSPHTLRAAHFSPLLALVVAVGAVAAADGVGAARRRVERAAVRTGLAVGLPLLALGVAGAELGARYRDYFGPYPATVAAAFNDGLAAALAYARKEEAGADEVWVEAFAQPYVFVLFHLAWPPSEVHTGLAVRRDPPGFNRVDAFDRYRFGEPAGIDVAGLPLLRTIKGVDGGSAYEVRGGEVAGRGRMVVVWRVGRTGRR